jgi:hypothetical protein
LNLIGAWSVITAKRMTSTNRRTQNHSLAVEHGDAPPAKINHLALSDASRQAPSGIAFFKAAHNPVVIIQ